MTLLIAALTLAIIFAFLKKRGGYIEFPFLMAVIILIWLLPQMRHLEASGSIFAEGLPSFSDFVLMCVLGTLIGFQVGKGQLKQVGRIASDGAVEVTTFVRYWPLIALTVFGFLVQVAIFSLPAGQIGQRMPTGPLAILKFFGHLKTVSLALSLLLYFQFRSRLLLILVISNLALFLPSIVLEFKRTQILTVGFVLVSTYWFSCRKEVPRLLLLSIAPLLMFVALGVSELRSISGLSVDSQNRVRVDLPTASDVLTIDWNAVLNRENARPEMRSVELQNAIAYRDVIDRRGSLTLGAQYWNRLVQLYVPGSIVGARTKQALKIGADLYSYEFLIGEDLSRIPGSTLTGFLQAYSDFSYMGWIVYFASGWILGRLYRKASSGLISQQVIYVSLAVMALSNFTHDSYRMLVYLPWLYVVSSVLCRLSFSRLVAMQARSISIAR